MTRKAATLYERFKGAPADHVERVSVRGLEVAYRVYDMTRKAAATLYERFTGAPADHVERVSVRGLEVDESLMYLGSLVAVAYEATRDGVTEVYEHEFRKSSRPVLAVTADGKNLYVLAGAYRVTEKGIEDR